MMCKKEQSLEETYAITCPQCSKSLRVKPSIFMEMGINRGVGSCPCCKVSLRFQLNNNEMSVEINSQK